MFLKYGTMFKFVLSMELCLLTVTLADTMFEFLLTAVMVGMWLLNAHIDSEHRAKALEAGPKVFILHVHVSYVYYSVKLNCYVFYTQVEMGRPLTFRTSRREH